MENKMSDKLIEAINEIANLPESDKTNIKGKFYTTVDKRLQTFRKYFGVDANVQTNILHNDLERVVVEATVSVYKDGTWREIGNDHAEEFRSQGMVNKTSALENCCTSAIGRALASCGLGGGEYASGFEVDNAINNKASAPDIKKGFVLKNNTGNPVTAMPDIETYLESLRKVLPDPNSQECIDIYTANADEIKRHRDELPKDDEKNLAVFDKLIKIYSEKVI
tara:strand:- start:1662 stop:2330 length:669 start_codon:yes stop_codon:yes gene_type:complete